VPLLESAIQTDPKNHQLYLALYSYYSETGQPEEGLKRLEDATKISATSPVATRALAHVELTNGNKEKMKKHIEDAIKITSEQNQKQDLLAEASAMYGQCGMPEEIVKLLEPQVNQIRQPFALLNLAQALFDVGRKDHARQLLNSLKQAAPEQMQTMIQQRLAAFDNAESAPA